MAQIWRVAGAIQLEIKVRRPGWAEWSANANRAPDVNFYPLRPEFAESTYLLYMATHNAFYLHVGAQIIGECCCVADMTVCGADSLNTQARAECGFATIHDVHTGALEDRMESFFLSETCKYLYLVGRVVFIEITSRIIQLFDEQNTVNRNYDKWVFSVSSARFDSHCTEG